MAPFSGWLPCSSPYQCDLSLGTQPGSRSRGLQGPSTLTKTFLSLSSPSRLWQPCSEKGPPKWLRGISGPVLVWWLGSLCRSCAHSLLCFSLTDTIEDSSVSSAGDPPFSPGLSQDSWSLVDKNGKKGLSGNKSQGVHRAFVLSPYPRDTPLLLDCSAVWPLGAAGYLGGWARKPSITEIGGMGRLVWSRGISALLEPCLEWWCQEPHVKEKLLSSNCHSFQIYLSGRKETGPDYGLIMCVLHRYHYQRSKLRKLKLTEVTLVV